MAEQTPESASTQSEATEESTSQNEAYKVFTTEDEYKQAQDKFFRGAYNEGKKKQEKDILNVLSGLGVEAESVDEALEGLKGLVAPAKEKQTEVDEVRDLLQKAQEEAQTLKQQIAQRELNERKAKQANSAFSELDGQLTLDRESVETLFYAQFDVVEDSGSFMVVKDGVPVLDDAGNRMSLSNAMKNFVRQKGFVKTAVKGVGGEAGATVASGKPSKAEWSKLLKRSDAGSQHKAAEMWHLSKELGWAE